ncbi:hypothetical protein I9H06_03075 [Pseudomonas tremae]|uniref:hypothetical protein n=1 Tax=Pseudomonas tremae TaxID=200454 RepID=UPI0018F72EA9|nr:hypothetical protein [Pseudomonas tremae]UQB32298.1 hypothetical protein I9H06_03075 [Pseudomonas tremae]
MAAPNWPPAKAALAPRAMPPTAPAVAPIFIAVLSDAILVELHAGHCDDIGKLLVGFVKAMM